MILWLHEWGLTQPERPVNPKELVAALTGPARRLLMTVTNDGRADDVYGQMLRIAAESPHDLDLTHLVILAPGVPA